MQKKRLNRQLIQLIRSHTSTFMLARSHEPIRKRLLNSTIEKCFRENLSRLSHLLAPGIDKEKRRRRRRCELKILSYYIQTPFSIWIIWWRCKSLIIVCHQSPKRYEHMEWMQIVNCLLSSVIGVGIFLMVHRHTHTQYNHRHIIERDIREKKIVPNRMEWNGLTRRSPKNLSVHVVAKYSCFTCVCQWWWQFVWCDSYNRSHTHTQTNTTQPRPRSFSNSVEFIIHLTFGLGRVMFPHYYHRYCLTTVQRQHRIHCCLWWSVRLVLVMMTMKSMMMMVHCTMMKIENKTGPRHSCHHSWTGPSNQMSALVVVAVIARGSQSRCTLDNGRLFNSNTATLPPSLFLFRERCIKRCRTWPKGKAIVVADDDEDDHHHQQQQQ